ncbi:MAG: DUF1295 domain-containing protein [Chloroflexota bacterium]
MTFLGIYVLALLLVVFMMIGLWLLSLVLRDSGIVDIFWGIGFVILAIFYFILTDGFGGRKILVTALVVIWGLRLASHIGYRNIGKPEDFRYKRWREKYGRDYWWVSFFLVFLLQGTVMWLVSAPVLVAQYHSAPAYFTLFDIAGAFLWSVGFFFEAVGDWQLMRFKADPANQGKVMNRGLWRYTRHPNYFGDSVQWWAFYLIAISVPWGLLTIFSPVLMTYLLVYVSGVAMLERSMRKKPKYDEYMRRTSKFFPMPPRRS